MAAKHTIVSMMKDEGHCLVEWLAFHRLIGFDNICVYTNNCTDGTDVMLMRMEEMGLCHHFRNDIPEGKKPQGNAFRLATNNPVVTETDWLLAMDADEFVNVKCGAGNLPDLLGAVPDATDAIAITWRFYGSNSVEAWDAGLVTEVFTAAAPDDFRKGWGVKTLFRPYEDMKLGIHRPRLKGGENNPDGLERMLAQEWVNGSGQDMPSEFRLAGWRSTAPTLGYDLVELNHYAVKSYQAYLLRRARGNVNNKVNKYDEAYFALFDRNEVEATNVARRAPDVRALMDDWLKDSTLRDLQNTANAFHAAQVDALRASGEYDTWLAALKEASATPFDKLDEVLFFQHVPKVWQERVRQMIADGVPKKTIAGMIGDNQTARKADRRAALFSAAKGDARDQKGRKVAKPDE